MEKNRKYVGLKLENLDGALFPVNAGFWYSNGVVEWFFFSALHSLCWLDSHLKVNNLILPVHVENNGFSLWETDHLGVTSLKYYRESMPWRTAWSTASPLRTWRDGEREACALRLSVLITEVNCGVIIRGRKAMRGEIPKNRRQVEIALFFPRAFERNIFMWLEI